MNKKIKTIIVILSLFSILGNSYTVEAKTYDKEDEVINVIRKNLLERDKEFTIKTTSDIAYLLNSKSEEYMNQAISIDKKSTAKDADYLAYSLRSYSISWQIVDSEAWVTYNVDYYLSSTKEKEVDKKVKSILKKLELEDASDYKKVKKIHDYVIKLAKYDETYSKYTAYDALINKSAVCQGYTLAAYRLFTEAGIKSKIITGYAGGGSHSWNIVKVNGKWYNIDLTWDDPLTYNREQVLRYDYFLKSDADFSDHFRDIEFSSVDFLSKYAVTDMSYSK